ncbi:hypothetical protein B0T19DRAFT_395011 [Cercophora scortea]|uniref:mRNA stability protein n=1 Tax=Cercophora scortea TaxID=314031 RepID=A0AAE0MKK4_9PEZI|nr:hypothetical protein B0T19DRAFT_395011 [Cercophora scortea]
MNSLRPKSVNLNMESLSPDELRLLRLYGRVPSFQSRHLKERKYFDSGDYALSKAGRGDNVHVGSLHPAPQNIPHPHLYPSPPIVGRKAQDGAKVKVPAAEQG